MRSGKRVVNQGTVHSSRILKEKLRTIQPLRQDLMQVPTAAATAIQVLLMLMPSPYWQWNADY